jgi:hypothetical protein
MAGLSKLQAVNLMLSNIGEAPVSTLSGAAGDAYVSTAENILDEVTRAAQEEGWEFNTDTNYDITPDISNNVVIANNVISMDTMPGGVDVTVRQGKLYNKTDHTFEFTSGAFPVEVVWEFAWDELPQYVRQYVATRAARVFSDRMQGDVTGAQLSADDEHHALVVARRHDARNADRTIFEGSPLWRMKYRGI